MNAPDHGNNVDNEAEGRGLSLIFNAPVALVGGGFVSETAFELAQIHAKKFIGVDSGGDAILARGLVPDAVIGDLDSLSEAGRQVIPASRVVHVAEQDTTDFEKALTRVAAPLCLGVGLLGPRLDHAMAALHVLVRLAHRPTVLIGETDLVFHVPARVALDLPAETRVSLFPLDGVRAGLGGLRWSFDALDLHPATRIGTSNAALGGAVHLSTDRPGLLAMVPVAHLDAVIYAMSHADFHSPPAAATGKGGL